MVKEVCHHFKAAENNPYHLQLSAAKPSSKIQNFQQPTSQLHSFNKFEGLIPASLGNLTLLTALDLSFNNFIGQVPKSLSNLGKFTNLSPGNNSLFGPIPDVFGDLSKLIYLDLSSNNFSGPLPPSAFNLTRLSVSDFSENQLDGQIPIQNSRNLQYLDVSSNTISGQITRHETELWSKLYFLNLSHNSFTSFEQNPSMINLQYLDLRTNLLQGPLPFVPPSMIVLSVANNKLSRLIPSWFCSLTSVQYLEAFNNSLSGPITQCLRNFS
ncbi:receptor-like protein 43 [Mangifera indica]|uniref:receptor-like protein 43 n=1 Tax=Mangifera indica TaxID=29780 RepID=UPI001CFA7AF1|nr:receptor-like protein 43 [Mangifera indica]